ncbi:TetR/AcrR family transcriptional regulator [Marinoscillum sp. MHG1-6]|uniref:TetR/AcrR family transcriptional regulator n=1 Tax=Marinoscillum sp. MHG1-6 TaxID=2959627 RepID=UPI0021577D5D|nr:TetR/AcrR family transcriptional regulator [Marinoscillum sp. MHG1-6]
MSPRSKQQFEELREASIRKILDASLELFGTTGYENTSIAQIAKVAGVSKGLIYNYFESKEAVLKVLIEDLTAIGDQMMADLFDEDPKQTLKNIFRMIFRWLRDHEKMNRLIFGMTLHVDRFDFVHELATTKMKGYVELLEQLLQQIGMEDYKTEARILSTIFDGIGVQYLVIKEDYPLDEIEEMLIKKYCA